MRILITALLLGACALAPVALAQTAGPTVPTGKALDGEIKTPSAKVKRARPAAKKYVARHTVPRTHGARTATRAKTAPHRVPAKHTATSVPGVALTV